MRSYETLVAVGVVLVVAVGPLILGVIGRTASRASSQIVETGRRWDWKLSIASALLYALAFNLVFITQELFLVLPKALTPGLRPTLFHNNHTWTGENSLENLFQGTGALATCLLGLVCMLLLRLHPPRSSAWRLFLIWMIYNGFLQALPQVVIGSVVPANDVGMAMGYLHLSVGAKTLAALVALIAIATVALYLRRPILSLAGDPDDVCTARERSRFVFRVAMLPALAAIALIIPFRVRRDWVEVVAVPVVVTLVGIVWIQAGAWAVSSAKANGKFNPKAMAYASIALLALLFLFQVILRHGIRFY